MSMIPSEHAWLLAIDTSTESVGLAVTDGAQLRDYQWLAEREQTTTVMREIERLLESAGVDRTRLTAIAVATGPGMFSGLRVGLAIAKGLHIGLGIPLI